MKLTFSVYLYGGLLLQPHLLFADALEHLTNPETCCNFTCVITPLGNALNETSPNLFLLAPKEVSPTGIRQ